MRAGVLAAPGEVRLIEAAIPHPGTGEVRVAIQGCGVCGSSIPVWEGRPWFSYPLAPGAPGHEGWGRVDAAGSKEAEPLLGIRVALLSYHAFAEYELTRADALVPLPPALDECDLPAEPLGCAMNIFRRSNIRSGQVVVILGVGFLGALLVQLVVHAGATVVAISRRPFALELARQLGAEIALPFDDTERIGDTLDALTGGKGAERVIEVIGEQRSLDLASELTAEGARLVIAGYHQDGLRQVNMQQWNWRGLDVVNAHERMPAVYLRGMREGIDAVARGVLSLTPLITHRFPLDDLGLAFQAQRERPDGFLKAVIIP
jgi:threonine dehydrogenase-like Zn-dependent dehydrogenase